MDTETSFVYIKTDDIYKDIAEDVEIRFGTSNYELNRSLPPKGKNKKVISVMKHEFVELRARTYSYLINDDSRDKKATGKKKCVIKIKHKF